MKKTQEDDSTDSFNRVLNWANNNNKKSKKKRATRGYLFWFFLIAGFVLLFSICLVSFYRNKSKNISIEEEAVNKIIDDNCPKNVSSVSNPKPIDNILSPNTFADSTAKVPPPPPLEISDANSTIYSAKSQIELPKLPEDLKYSYFYEEVK